MDFNIKEYAHCFETAPDEAYFWHGQTNGIGGQLNALNIAEERGGKTLEMCMFEHREELKQAGVNFDVEFKDGKSELLISYGKTYEENQVMDIGAGEMQNIWHKFIPICDRNGKLLWILLVCYK